MNRRKFLITGGLSTVGVLAGSAIYRVRGVWWDQESSAQYSMLSPREAQIADAIADAMFPGDHLGMPNGTEVGVVQTLDDYLAAINPHTANLLRLLLHAIDELAIVSGLSMTRFHRRSREKRKEILRAWDTSRVTARREAFFGLKIILCMGYCESPRVIRAAGWNYDCGAWL